MRIVDHDTIELSNLNRQLLYRRGDVGRLKVDVAAEAILAFNPSIVVEPVAQPASGPDDVARAIKGRIWWWPRPIGRRTTSRQSGVLGIGLKLSRLA